MKNICIVYNPGAYGNFIEWCLPYFSDLNFTEDLPFLKDGSAHKFVGVELGYLYNDGGLDYINSPSSDPIVRMHFNNSEKQNYVEDLQYIKDNFRKVIFLHCTENSIVWNINNKFDKTHPEIGYLKTVYGKEFIESSETWEIRQFLSYKAHVAHVHESLVYQIDDLKQVAGVKFISIDNLRDNFKQSIIDMLTYCELPQVRDDFDRIYDAWISLQIHKDKDHLLKEIVSKTLDYTYFDWSDQSLTIVDEAIIQTYLRAYDLTLLDHKLNIFPTNSFALSNKILERCLGETLDIYASKLNLPRHIFFTGVPGSRWSGIAQILETIPGMNTSDRRPDREYTHNTYSGHVGAYFGKGMEFQAYPSTTWVDRAWAEPGGCKLVKSHDWAYYLDAVSKLDNSWIMLVHRPDQAAYDWWQAAGGFDITYPCYDAYKDNETMMAEITAQNKAILEFATINNCKWEYFTSRWIKENFNADVNVAKVWPDILVTLIK